MYRLRLLGGLELEGPSGPLSGRVVQRRQLALLALLAASLGGGLSRDKLLGYLWPESNEERARHRLSDTLHVIRKALGEGAVLVSGELLRLNPELVWTDGLEVVSWSSEAGTQWRPVRFITRRWYEGEMIEVRTKMGRRVLCTPDHPLVVSDGEGAAPSVKLAADVGDTDWMPLAFDRPMSDCGSCGNSPPGRSRAGSSFLLLAGIRPE